jgi:hypothetical protein
MQLLQQVGGSESPAEVLLGGQQLALIQVRRGGERAVLWYWFGGNEV